MNIAWVVAAPVWLLAIVLFVAGVCALARPIDPPKTDHDGIAFVTLMLAASACAYIAARICGLY